MRASYRIVAGHALVVSRASGRMHRLDRVGTEIWRVLSDAAPASIDADAILEALARFRVLASAAADRVEVELFLCDLERAGLIASDSTVPFDRTSSAGHGAPGGHTGERSLRPRRRELSGAWELVDEIEPAPRARSHRVGDGFLLRDPGNELSLLAGDAAAVWEAIRSRPRPFVELIDVLCDGRGLDQQQAASTLARVVLQWRDAAAILGIEQVDRLRQRLLAIARGSTSPDSEVRTIGRLEPTTRSGALPPPTRLGSRAVVRDKAGAVQHVAIVCQYGIQDLAPGVEPYTQRCIERLRRFEPEGAAVDLVILAGGGRHGRSQLREAESVIDRYRALLPGPALWVEKHSATTWENLQSSLEMLDAREVVPRQISFLGDRARIEKLRVACWIARRRFASLRDVELRAVPIARPRFTWRDNRAVQLLVGSAQVVKESRERLGRERPTGDDGVPV